MTESEIRALANTAAERVAKNAGVAEQLCFPHIYLTLKDALGGPAPALAGDAQPVAAWLYTRSDKIVEACVDGPAKRLGSFVKCGLTAYAEPLYRSAPPLPVAEYRGMHEENARYAIDEAIARGRESIQQPPANDHWLMPYWLMGQRLARLEAEFAAITDETEPGANSVSARLRRFSKPYGHRLTRNKEAVLMRAAADEIDRLAAPPLPVAQDAKIVLAEVDACVKWAEVAYRNVDEFDASHFAVAQEAWVERARRTTPFLPTVAPQEQSAPDAEESEAWNTLAASEAQEAIAGSQAAAPVTGGSIDTAEFDDLIAEIWCATLDGKRGGKAEANLVAHIDAHTAQAVAQARGEVAAHQKAHVDQLKAQIAGHEGMFDLLKRERDSLLGVSVPEGWRNALHAAVSAIYFDDNSDYKSALVSVVRHLSPELASELLSSPKAAYEKSQAILATKEPQ